MVPGTGLLGPFATHGTIPIFTAAGDSGIGAKPPWPPLAADVVWQRITGTIGGYRAGSHRRVAQSRPLEATFMCLLAIQYKTARDAPILVAANREEYFDRPSQAPRIQSGRPRVICGIDRKAGGTWFGVNQHGLCAAVANRPKADLPHEPRSRGLLCREMLNLDTATKASDYAARELQSGRYAGANFVCADAQNAYVIHGGETVEVVALEPGLHVLTSSNVNDPSDERQEFVRRLLTLQRLDSAVAFLAVASRTFSRKPDAFGRRGVVTYGPEYGTVSSTLLSLPRKNHNAVYHYAPGPPSEHGYDDLSALLRQVLSTEK